MSSNTPTAPNTSGNIEMHIIISPAMHLKRCTCGLSQFDRNPLGGSSFISPECSICHHHHHDSHHSSTLHFKQKTHHLCKLCLIIYCYCCACTVSFSTTNSHVPMGTLALFPGSLLKTPVFEERAWEQGYGYTHYIVAICVYPFQIGLLLYIYKYKKTVYNFSLNVPLIMQKF